MSSGVLILTFFTIGNGLQITGHRNRTRRFASFLTIGLFRYRLRKRSVILIYKENRLVLFLKLIFGLRDAFELREAKKT